jgi:hypothetical protein
VNQETEHPPHQSSLGIRRGNEPRIRRTAGFERRGLAIVVGVVDASPKPHEATGTMRSRLLREGAGEALRAEPQFERAPVIRIHGGEAYCYLGDVEIRCSLPVLYAPGVGMGSSLASPASEC